jgi:hypothetical protein
LKRKKRSNVLSRHKHRPIPRQLLEGIQATMKRAPNPRTQSIPMKRVAIISSKAIMVLLMLMMMKRRRMMTMTMTMTKFRQLKRGRSSKMRSFPCTRRMKKMLVKKTRMTREKKEKQKQ